MITMKCKMCGGALEIVENTTVVECEYCGSKQTLPKMDDERKVQLFERANFYRAKSEFDKASALYENILVEEPNEAEAYWGICLCRYGIEYVVDPTSQKRIPTCHRAQYTSILEDKDYLSAIENADLLAKEVYIQEAEYIDKVQKDILKISSKEEPFDIFICYKETDENGNRTLDSVEAQKLYKELTKEGYKVFFARITLEDKIGTAYEPYIFAALNSAKIMLVLGTKPEHFNAVWVKNEWSRFLSLINQGQSKTIIPCYKDMAAEELPDELSYLQAQDMSKLAYEQDLIRGIEKLINKQPIAKNKETVIQQINNVEDSLEQLCANAKTYLEGKNFETAKNIYTRITTLYADHYEGWWGLILSHTENLSLYNADDETLLKEWFGYAKASAPESIYKDIEEQYVEYIASIAIELRESYIDIFNQKKEHYLKKIEEENAAIEEFKKQKSNIIVAYERLKRASETKAEGVKERIETAAKHVSAYKDDVAEHKKNIALKYYLSGALCILIAILLVFVIGSGFFGRLLCIAAGLGLGYLGFCIIIKGSENKEYDKSKGADSITSRKSKLQSERNYLNSINNISFSDEKEKKYWIEHVDRKINMFESNISSKEKSLKLMERLLGYDHDKILTVLFSEKCVAYGIPHKSYAFDEEMDYISATFQSIDDAENNCQSSYNTITPILVDNNTSQKNLIDYVRTLVYERIEGQDYTTGGGVFNTSIITVGVINPKTKGSNHTIKFEIGLVRPLEFKKRLTIRIELYDELGNLITSFAPWWEDTQNKGISILNFKWNIVNQNEQLVANKGKYRAVFRPNGYPPFEFDFEIK